MRWSLLVVEMTKSLIFLLIGSLAMYCFRGERVMGAVFFVRARDESCRLAGHYKQKAAFCVNGKMSRKY